MPTVAEQLRQGREALKLDVQQVAETTKLKTDQIRALEEGNYDYFTAPVYLRGSLRTYANLLKLDAHKLVAELEAESTSTVRADAQGEAATRKRSGVDSLMLLVSRNWGIAAGIIIIALIAFGSTVAYRAWKARKSYDPLKGLSSGMYQPAEPSGEILPLPTNVSRRVP